MKSLKTVVSFGNIRKAFAFLIVGIGITIFVASYTGKNAEALARSEYGSVCNEIKMKIESRLHAHAEFLRAGSAFFEASDTVTRQQWKEFIKHTKIDKNLRGIQGTGFSLVIPRNQLQGHIDRIRKEGFPAYTVKPVGERDVYTSIIYLEPFSGRNLRAFGYDMFSDQVRRKAMELSRDSDIAMLSGKVFLVQETSEDVQTGTLMYVPVYRIGAKVNTVDERREAIKGWVYSPYRMNDLMEGILGRWDLLEEDRIHLQVYDDSISKSSLLYDSQENNTIQGNDLSSRSLTLSVVFNSKKWVLYFSQSKDYLPFSYSKVIIVFICGMIISLLLFGLFLSLINTNTRALLMTGKLTRELKESEKRFSLFMDHLPTFAFIKDNNGKTLFVNKFMDSMLGASKWFGKDMFEVFPTGFGEKLLADDLRVLKQGDEKIEESIMLSDEKLHYFETQKFIILNQDKEPFLGGISLDITERKIAGELLLQTRQNYETFFNTISDFLFVLDEQGNMVHVNSTVLNRLGYTWDELSGNSVLLVHPPERRGEAGRIVGEMLQGITEFCPVPLITKPGKQIPVETRIKQGTWDGKPAIFGVTKDISRIQHSEEKFSKMFHLNPSACGLSDLDTHEYLEVNEAFYTLFGFNKGEVIGKTAFNLGIFTVEAANAVMKLADNRGTVTNVEATLVAKNGDLKHVLLFAENIYVQDKKCRFTVVLDITERKKAEEELKKSETELRELNATKDKFFSIIAHDLRNPFNAILGFSDLLIERVKEKDYNDMDKFALTIYQSSKRAMDLLMNLMEWSRIQTGRMAYHPRYFELPGFLGDIVPLFDDIAGQKSITIKRDFPANAIVFADQAMISTVFRNLISNAIKFTRSGGKVILTIVQEQDGVLVSVWDSGIGIPETRIGQLFRIDQSYSTTGTNNEQGTGLGLVLCKEFVEKNGGKIWVESKEGIGSVFYFTLKT